MRASNSVSSYDQRNHRTALVARERTHSREELFVGKWAFFLTDSVWTEFDWSGLDSRAKRVPSSACRRTHAISWSSESCESDSIVVMFRSNTTILGA
jgi:hypothetical protein